MATREAILEALLAVIASSGDFALTGRRNRAPETIGPSLSPAVFLVKALESWRRPSPSLAADPHHDRESLLLQRRR